MSCIEQICCVAWAPLWNVTLNNTIAVWEMLKRREHRSVDKDCAEENAVTRQDAACGGYPAVVTL